MHKYIIRKYKYNYYKLFKIAPTCFGSQGIHHQGVLCRAWLKFSNGSIVTVDMDVVGVMAAYLPVVCVVYCTV